MELILHCYPSVIVKNHLSKTDEIIFLTFQTFLKVTGLENKSNFSNVSQ